MTSRALTRKAIARPNYLLTPGTIVAEGQQFLVLQPEHVSRHVFLAGGSGGGKTFLIQSLTRQLASQGQGASLLDPHGDGCRSVLEWLSLRPEIDPKKILYLRPGSFSLDPFAQLPVEQYEEALWAMADRIVKAFLRSLPAADVEVMVRQRRWLKNAVVACGTKTARGTHAGLDKLLTFLAPADPDFARLFADVEPRLPPEVRVDYHKLIATQRPRDQEAWVESSINRAREVLSPAVRRMFGQRTDSLCLRDIILCRKLVLLDLAESATLSREQANIVGGLYLSLLQTTARQLGDELPPEKRVVHHLLIDEAENFLGDDLRMGFVELRKFGLPCFVSVQDMSCLQKGDLDLQSKVVSQCGLQMTMQQGNPDDIEFLAKVFGYPSLDLTPHLQKQVLPDGYDWVGTRSVTIAVSEQRTQSQSQSESTSHQTSRQTQTSASIQRSVALALSGSASEGVSEQVSEATSTGRSQGETQTTGSARSTQISRTNSATETRGWSSGDTWSQSETRGSSEGQSRSGSDSRTRTVTPAYEVASATSEGRTSGSSKTASEALSQGHTASESDSGSYSQGASAGRTDGASSSATRGVSLSTSEGKTAGRASGVSRSTSQGASVTAGVSAGQSAGSSQGESTGQSQGTTLGESTGTGRSTAVGYQKTPLARHRTEVHPTGHLVVSVQDQLARLYRTISTLPDRVLLAKVKGMSQVFLLKTHEVRDPWLERYGRRRSDAWRRDDVARFLARVPAAHACYFDPLALATPTTAAAAPAPAKVRSREKVRARQDENPIA